MTPPLKTTNWTMRKQLRIIILIAVLSTFLFGLFGAWRVQQFYNRRIELQLYSQKLQANLQDNFNKTKTIGQIHTHLRLYMQSGKATHLKVIRDDVDQLLKNTTAENKTRLLHFLEVIDILEVRMNSLQENNKKIFQAETLIQATNAGILKSLDPVHYRQLQPLISKVCLEHHHLYVTSIITNQKETLKNIQESYSKLFFNVDAQVVNFIKNFPPSQKKSLEKLRDLYFELDDGVQTITAIRITTLETQNATEKVLESINSGITQNSLSQTEEASTLMGKSLKIAQQNLIILSSILVLSALMFAFIAFFLNQRMITPLVDFVDLLRRMTKLLAEMRSKRVSEDENFLLLADMSKRRQDEIGEVAMAVKSLIIRLRELSLFRQTIEADETTIEIYTRLARIFETKLGLSSFTIFEKSSEDQGLAPIYCQPPELVDELPEFTIAEKCRAQRTGTLITSLEDPSICKQFPFPDVMDHICIPMIVGGQVIGVVQFLTPLSLNREKQSDMTKAVEEARHYIAEALPVLQSKHLARKLEEMATKDQLTGLYNRRYLETSLDQIVAGTQRRKTKLGVLMCDMDYFKEVNDTHGHDSGDAVLVQLADIFNNCARKSDLVIRFGGEEFLILQIDVESEQAKVLAERIRKSVEEHQFQLGSTSIYKTLSIGVAEFPIDSTQGIWETIKHADVALYKAKEDGRNQVVIFDEKMWEGQKY